MRILFLSGWYPYPPDNGSKLRIYSLLRGLAQEHEVSLITFADPPPASPSQELEALCDEVRAVALRRFRPRGARALIGFMSPTPRVIVDMYSSLMREEIENELLRRRYDLVVASQWVTACYWSSFAGLPAVFEEVELGSFEAKKNAASSLLQSFRHQLPLLKLRRYYGKILPHFQACTVASEEEAARLRRLVPGFDSIEVIPNCIDLGQYEAVPDDYQPHRLIFTGSLNYFANYDAMIWFLDEIYDRIKGREPSAELLITGDHGSTPPPDKEGVILTGHLPDPRPMVASAAVSLAPMRLGGGTRLKILEAMAIGTPVVATSLGAEGLDAVHGEHLLIADAPEAFSEAVLALFAQPNLRRHLIQNARRLVKEKYDYSVIVPQFLSLVQRVEAMSISPSQAG